MTKINKLIEKFLANPRSVKYSQLELILQSYGFEIIRAKGSHIKCKHKSIPTDLVIPVHNGDCKDFYKVLAKKQIDLLSKE